MFIARETNPSRRRSEERKEGACLRATCIPLLRTAPEGEIAASLNMRTPNGVETASAVGPRQQNSMSFHWVAVLQLCLVLRWNQGCRRLAPRRRRFAEVRRGSGHSRIKQVLVVFRKKP